MTSMPNMKSCIKSIGFFQRTNLQCIWYHHFTVPGIQSFSLFVGEVESWIGAAETQPEVMNNVARATNHFMMVALLLGRLEKRIDRDQFECKN